MDVIEGLHLVDMPRLQESYNKITLALYMETTTKTIKQVLIFIELAHKECFMAQQFF